MDIHPRKVKKSSHKNICEKICCVKKNWNGEIVIGEVSDKNTINLIRRQKHN